MPRILVVEDNDDVRRVVTMSLRSKGYGVLEAPDGVAGLEAAAQHKPDAVLLDVLLPRLDGIEVLRRLRGDAEYATLPVIMMSAVIQTRDLLAETARLNVSAFLAKPFQIRKLFETIESVLGSAPAPPRIAPRKPTAGPRATVPRQAAQPATTAPAAGAAPAPRPPDQTAQLRYDRPPLPPSGTLEQLSFPEIIHGVFTESRTGRLRVSTGTTEKRIYFQNGLPVYAESSIPAETLGAHMQARGRVTAEQHRRAVEEMKRTGRQYGDTLLKLGLIGPHELFTELEAHLAGKIISTFAWREGTFTFEDGDAWKDDVIIARMRPGRIMLDGLHGHWSPVSVRQLVDIRGSCTAVPVEGSIYTADMLELSTREAKVAQLARRGTSVDRIVAEVGDTDLVYTTLFGFYVMEQVAFEPGATFSLPAVEDVGVGQLPVTPSQPPKKEEHAKELLAEYLKYRTADYFKLLGVSRDATPMEIEQAFRARQKRYHADTLVGIDTGLVHEKIEELYVRVHTAYRTLLNAETRQAYVAKLDQGAPGTLLGSREKTAQHSTLKGKPRHEQLFELGFVALRNGAFADARDLFASAEQLAANPRYRAFRAWAGYLADPGGAKHAAESTLEELRSSGGKDPLFAHLLGNLHLREGRTQQAIAAFEQALAIDPQHIDSARQLRILRRRAHASEVSGLFDIFKKR